MPLRSRRYLILLAVLTLLLVGAILTDMLPFLRGPAPETSEWFWHYRLRPFNRWWLPAFTIAGIWLLLHRWLQNPHSKIQNYLILLTLIIAHLCLQLSLVYADRPDVPAEMIDRTLAQLTSGFFFTAVEIEDMGETLRQYPAQMTQFSSEHARTHPPGIPLLNWLTIRFFARFPPLAQPIANQVYPQRCTDLWLLNRPPQISAALGVWSILPAIAGAFSLLPLWGLANQLTNKQAAKMAVAMGATLPALALFTPKSVQLYAPLTLATLTLLHHAGKRNSIIYALTAGILLSFATFLSLNNTPLWLIGSILLLFTVQTRYFWQLWAVFCLGCGSVWLIYWAGWGVPPWRIASVALGQHYQLVTTQRRYSWWLLWNLVDVMIYAGIPLLITYFAGSWQLAKNQSRTPLAGLAVALFATLLLLDIAGSTRGEVGRLWLFLFLPMTIISAPFLTRHFSTKGLSLLIGLQLLLTFSLGVAWRPVQAVIVVAETPEMPAIPTHVNHPNQTRFGDHIQYLGTNLTQTGQTLTISHIWQADDTVSYPYTLFNHLVDSAGNLITQQDDWSVGGTYPPTCWQNGEQIVDIFELTLPEKMPAGEVHLIFGWYSALTNQRLLTPDGADSLRVTITPLSNNKP